MRITKNRRQDRVARRASHIAQFIRIKVFTPADRVRRSHSRDTEALSSVYGPCQVVIVIKTSSLHFDPFIFMRP